MGSCLVPLLLLGCSTLRLDGTEKPLLIFKAVFELILCQSQSLLQDGHGLCQNIELFHNMLQGVGHSKRYASLALRREVAHVVCSLF